jgi:hypothetical protein
MRRRGRAAWLLTAAVATAAALASAVQSCAVTSSGECADKATCAQADAPDVDSPNPLGLDASVDVEGGGDVVMGDLASRGDELATLGDGNSDSDGAASDDGGGADAASENAGSNDSSESATGEDGLGADASDGGGVGDAGACPAGLLDKTTACTAATPTCIKGCGPNTATANLGTKDCSCNLSTMVYNCQMCAYPNPLPMCYAPAPTPPACVSGVADGVACTTPCGGVCTLVTDAGKTDGCVCVQGSSSTKWSCATQWW